MQKNEIIRIAKEELAKSEGNNYAALGFADDKIWVNVELGFAAGDDPLFAEFKQDIGDFFWLPEEAFAKFYPREPVNAKDLTVISLCYAIDDNTRNIQAGQKFAPSYRWLYARNSYEPIIQGINRNIIARLAEQGIRAVAPDEHADWAWRKSEKYGWACNWSLRHVAYAAGLGTFGLCDGLITRQGKAVRFSSLIVDTALPIEPRPYTGHHDWCLFYAKGSCPSCIKACPVGAITEQGHDKDKCEQYITDFKISYTDSKPINSKGPFGCGLCQGNVPCQKGVPKGLDKQAL